MIARIWTARTTRTQAPAYAEHLRTHVFARLGEIEGFVHALLLQREVADGVEVEVITFWRSLESIRAFAGPDAGAAVVTGTASALLTDYDRRTKHFQVVLGDDLAGKGG
ncbi:MAG: antibiotic biosynthesis monooxygenase family protein [Vicinamibacterales bacterium]